MHEDRQKTETVAYRLQEYRCIGVDNLYEFKLMPIFEEGRVLVGVNPAYSTRLNVSLAV
jgi:hypothetical protein